MDTVVQLITTLGFPIVTACALFWYIVTDGREMRKVVDNNTSVLLRILEHFKDEDDSQHGEK